MHRIDRLIIGRIIALLLCLAPLVLLVPPTSGQVRRKGSYNSAAKAQQQKMTVQAAQAQIAAAKEVLAAAESTGSDAKAKLDAAVAKLKESSQQLKESQSAVRKLAKQLDEMEDSILHGQPADSPYAKAGAEVESARQALTDIESRILAEPDVQSALAGLTGPVFTSAKVARLNSRPEYAEAKSKLDAAAAELDRQRRELLRADQAWVSTSDALAKARKEEKDAEAAAHAGPRERVDASHKIQSAAETAAAARAAIAQAEAILQAAGGNKAAANPNAKKKN